LAPILDSNFPAARLTAKYMKFPQAQLHRGRAVTQIVEWCVR
jgi:hypothetical protein